MVRRSGRGRSGTVGGRAVWPGLTGGAYKPLNERDIQRINATALDLLENIGIGDPIPQILDYALPGGCTLGEDGRLRFPRELVEDMVDVSAKSYVAHAPDPRFDHEVGGDRVYFTTAGEAVSILDYASQTFRPTRLVDLYDAARLADTLEHIQQFGQPLSRTDYTSGGCAYPRTVPDPFGAGRHAARQRAMVTILAIWHFD
jgi:trimethylamine--corrinoid protein Co-methyltransferase